MISGHTFVKVLCAQCERSLRRTKRVNSEFTIKLSVHKQLVGFLQARLHRHTTKTMFHFIIYINNWAQRPWTSAAALWRRLCPTSVAAIAFALFTLVSMRSFSIWAPARVNDRTYTHTFTHTHTPCHHSWIYQIVDRAHAGTSVCAFARTIDRVYTYTHSIYNTRATSRRLEHDGGNFHFRYCSPSGDLCAHLICTHIGDRSAMRSRYQSAATFIPTLPCPPPPAPVSSLNDIRIYFNCITCVQTQ